MSIDTTGDITATADLTTAAAITSSTVYATASPNRAPEGYVGRHRCRDEFQDVPRSTRRGRKLLAAALALVGIWLKGAAA